MRAGWQFLRAQRTLFANTIQAAIAQFTIGITIALVPIYAFRVFEHSDLGWQAVYGFLEAGIGVGNLLGGFVIGLIGARFGKGRLVIAGYAVWGLMVALMALTGHVGLAIGFSFGQGVANMVFVIPTQTLFQELTPAVADGARDRDPVRDRVRVDDPRDGPRGGHGRVRRRLDRDRVLRVRDHDRRGWPACSCRRSATPDGRRPRAFGTLAPASRSQAGATAPRSDTTE